MATLYITLIQRRKKNERPLVTLTFEDMVTKNLCNPGCVLYICAQNEVDPTISLGEVRPHTHRQTNRGPTAIIV